MQRWIWAAVALGCGLLIGEIAGRLKELNVDLTVVDFIRYADARTAIATGSLDMATVGPADLPILLSKNINNIVGLMVVPLFILLTRAGRPKAPKITFSDTAPRTDG